MLCLLISFTSCGDAAGEVEDTGAVDDLQQAVGFKITPENLDDLCVIRGDMSSDIETKAAVKIRKAVGEALGIEMKISTDWEKNPKFTYEIIVGKTLREDTENVKIDRISLGKNGFEIRAVGTKLYVCGGSPDGTDLGADFFVANILPYAKDGTLAVAADYRYREFQQYDIPELQINGKNSAEYKIVTSDKNMKAAEALRSALYDKTGVYHEITTSKVSGGCFMISDEAPAAKGVIRTAVEGDSLVFSTSSTTLGIDSAVASFARQYIADTKGSINFPAGFEYVDLGDYIVVNY